MNPLKIAFVGIGQGYASHLWMGRMRQMFGDQIVVNIDDMRNTPRDTVLSSDTQYIPKKLSRFQRVMRSARLTTETDEKLRSEWMLKTITQSKPSLVFVHFLDFATQFHEVWKRLDLPVAVHCHGYDITWDVRHHVNGTPLHREGYQDLVRSLPENVWFIANSTHTQRQLRKLDINPEKIFLKRFGVPLADQPRKLLASPKPQILFLGRLVDFKGPQETLRAFAQIASKHPEAKLHLAGDGPLKAELNQLAGELQIEGSTVFHGSVSQNRGKELRERSAIFTAHNQKGITTGQEEAFGVSLLEAMGEGIPVVTGRSGGIPDFVKHQENGLLFDPGDIGAHAGMLDDLLSSKKHLKSLGQAAWETVRDHYQPHHERADLNRIFEHISQVGTCPTLDQSRSQAA